MGILDFITNRGPVIQTIELKKAFDAARYGMQGVPQYPDSDRLSLVEWQRRNELVYACIRKKCEAAADPEIVVEKKNSKGEWETIEGHPFSALLEKPNPDDTFDTFLSAWVSSEECTGDFYAEIVRDNGGVPVALYPLDPCCMFPIPDAKGGIAKYEFRSGHGSVVELNPRDVLHRRKPDLKTRYFGLAPLKVALGSVDADQSQTDFTRAFFHSDGVPAGLLKVLNKTMSQEEAATLQQGWMRRFRRGGSQYKQVAVLDQNAEYQKIGSNIGEIESEITRGQSETRICMVFGIPPALVGAYVGLQLATNNATMRVHMQDFWFNTMSPMLKTMRVWMTWNMLTEFEPLDKIAAKQIRVNWDMTQVMAMQEDEDKRHDRARKNFQAGGWTINEFRETTGLDPIEGDDYFLQPKSIEPMSDEIRALLASQEPQKVPAADDVVDGEIVDEPKQLEVGKALKKKTFDYNGLSLAREPTEIEKLIDLKGMVDAYDSSKMRINRVLLSIRKDLIAQAADAVAGHGAEDVYALTLTPPATAYNKLRREIDAAFDMGCEQVARDLAAQMKAGAPSEVKKPKGSGFLSRLVDLLIARVVNEIQTRAVNLFTMLGTLGLSDEEIVDRIKSNLDEQSLRIFESFATQAANAAINAGRREEMLDRADEIRLYEYSALLDVNTCAECEDADGMQAEDIDDLPPAPNDNCLGGAQCRCFIIGIGKEGNA